MKASVYTIFLGVLLITGCSQKADYDVSKSPVEAPHMMKVEDALAKLPYKIHLPADFPFTVSGSYAFVTKFGSNQQIEITYYSYDHQYITLRVTDEQYIPAQFSLKGTLENGLPAIYVKGAMYWYQDNLFYSVTGSNSYKEFLKVTNSMNPTSKPSTFDESAAIALAKKQIPGFPHTQFPDQPGKGNGNIHTNFFDIGPGDNIPGQLETKVEKSGDQEYTVTLIETWNAKSFQREGKQLPDDTLLHHEWKFRVTPAQAILIEHEGNQTPLPIKYYENDFKPE